MPEITSPHPTDILPRSDKDPLKANAFWVVQHANAQLTPLFPYRGPGDLLPCVSAQRGGREHGYFVHINTVDEILITLGGGGRLRTGLVRLGPREHGVSGPAADHPEEFGVTVVTQRQSESGPQVEAVIFKCANCSAELYRHDFDAMYGGRDVDGHALAHPPLGTLVGSAEAAIEFNTEAARRVCRACGQANQSFPLASWGWDDHVRRSEIANSAQHALQEALGDGT